MYFIAQEVLYQVYLILTILRFIAMLVTKMKEIDVFFTIIHPILLAFVYQ